MREYKICVRDSTGQVVRQETWNCEDEDQAVDQARQLARRCTVEVWDSAICIESLELGAPEKPTRI